MPEFPGSRCRRSGSCQTARLCVCLHHVCSSCCSSWCAGSTHTERNQCRRESTVNALYTPTEFLRLCRCLVLSTEAAAGKTFPAVPLPRSPGNARDSAGRAAPRRCSSFRRAKIQPPVSRRAIAGEPPKAQKTSETRTVNTLENPVGESIRQD